MYGYAGGGVNALRKSMQKGSFSGGTVPQRRNMLVRSAQAVSGFLFSGASAALLLGAGVGALCTASGLAGILGGSVCAVSAMGATTFFRSFFATTPFWKRPTIPLSLGAFLAGEFERTLTSILATFGVLRSQHAPARNMEKAALPA